MIGKVIFICAVCLLAMACCGSCQLDKYYELVPNGGNVNEIGD